MSTIPAARLDRADVAVSEQAKAAAVRYVRRCCDDPADVLAMLGLEES